MERFSDGVYKTLKPGVELRLWKMNGPIFLKTCHKLGCRNQIMKILISDVVKFF